MHTLELLKEVCIFIFGEPGCSCACLFPSAVWREHMKKEQTCLFVEYTVSARCASARPVFFLYSRAERFPLSLLCSAQWSLLCYSCGPASSRVRSSADPVDRRGAGARPARHNNSMSTQHFMSILAEVFYKTWPRLLAFLAAVSRLANWLPLSWTNREEANFTLAFI